MATEMINRDIKDFTTVSSVEPSDYIVLSLFKGTSGKVAVSLFRSVVAKGITPSIGSDGYWLIGDENTQVPAEGKTPEFRKGTVAVEWRYTTEDDSSWRPLLSFQDLRLKYEDLTDEQLATLKLKYEDLTEEDIAELQKPATEAAKEIREQIGNQTLAVELEEDGTLSAIVGDMNTEFQEGYIEDTGDLVLVFEFD